MAGALISPTLLGYPDEEIQDKHLSQIDFTTSKIGGLPVSGAYKIRVLELEHTSQMKPRLFPG